MSQPTKEQTRKWLQNRSTAKTPPPTPEQIKRELGWDLTPKTNHERKPR